MNGKIVEVCIAAIAVCVLALVACMFVPAPVRPDYTVTLCVDQSEQVEQAVSNAMHEVVRRDFVPAGLTILRTLNGGFAVRCKGIERGNLLSLD